ncbi:MAG: DUF6398 domain-containing protein [Chloroflexi bacterium]|nr:DUF6398 domain-containing protein [Chloroflexota bacterium]
MVKQTEESVPKQMRPLFDQITAITDEFCREHLTDEYAQLCRKAAAALCRKRPSPLLRGDINTWICSIVYAVGSVNFLFDKSQMPHMTAVELCDTFGVSKSTCAAKARKIEDALRIGQFDPRWTRPSKLDENPLAWFIKVDGFIIDARDAPREIQEEALRRGLIPYLPPES